MARQKPVQIVTLESVLKRYAVEGELYEKLPDGKVRCYACGHRCLILPGLEGICKVRYNEGGKLYVPANYVAALNCDPIEKKPFFHVLPGSRAMTFGMLGCDLHCSYCQNWLTSQALRDPVAGTMPEPITAEEIVALSRRYRAASIISSYNEPLITSEWAVMVFKQAKKENFLTGYVSNGNATAEVLDYIRPWTDLYKIDLKTFSDRNYRSLGGTLQSVLETCRMVYERGFWMEIVTLIVPGFNDSDRELRDIARFIRSLSPDIPWHVTAFHKDYKMTDPSDTPPSTLIRAAEIGYGEGLHFVYAGNIPGQVSSFENTYCPDCNTLLVERYGFHVLRVTLDGSRCPRCRRVVPGIWTQHASTEN
ncbi:MAG TPA: AmmeMemoRadiSam system radical SAM enzyme [Blastocatellia bacterium]|nr:AmmeMemoRadiSam system radical SAM enzyme [Blastocatellia bacterium]